VIGLIAHDINGTKIVLRLDISVFIFKREKGIYAMMNVPFEWVEVRNHGH